MTSFFYTSRGMQLHVRHYGGSGPVMLLLHGLTANGAAFEGLVAHGLTAVANVFTLDLRGRGLSDAPHEGYTVADHAADVVDLFQHMGWQQIVLGGHSYGAFLSWYLAAHYPQYIYKVIAMDAAMRMNPRTLEMLGPSLGRLQKTWPSFEAYLNDVKKAPYLTFWAPEMEAYYRADVRLLPEGGVAAIPSLDAMSKAAQLVLSEAWGHILPKVKQPVLMVHAPHPYTFGEPLLPEPFAKETAAFFTEIFFLQVPGNHQTMLYGTGAETMVKAIAEFLRKPSHAG